MTINLDKIRENALVGIRRAALFMGFAVNCSENPELNNFELTHHSYIRFLPDIISQDRITEIKNEFKGWVIFNAIRELTDSFEFYLNDLLKVIYQADIFLDGLSNFTKNDLKQFENQGIENKLLLLKNKKQIEPTNIDCLISIQKVRNCITHRRGFVKAKDFNGNNQLSVKWVAPDMFIISKEHKNKIDYPIMESYIINQGEQMIVEYSKRIKTFKRNDFINFSVKDLSEICFYVNLEIDKIYETCIKFFKGKNVNFIKDEENKKELT